MNFFSSPIIIFLLVAGLIAFVASGTYEPKPSPVVTAEKIESYTPPQETPEQSVVEAAPLAPEETVVADAETAVPVPGVAALDALREFGTHQKILQIIAEAGAEAQFSGASGMTFFAPSDEAFAAAEKGSFEQLLAAGPEQIQAFLAHYTVAGKMGSADILAAAVEGKTVLTSLAGTDITLSWMADGGPLAIEASGEKTMLPYTDIVRQDVVIYVTPRLLP